MWHIVNGLLKNEHKSCRSKWDPTQTQLRWTWSRHPCGVPCGFNLFDFWIITFPFLKYSSFPEEYSNNRNNKRIQQQHQVIICFYVHRKIVEFKLMSHTSFPTVQGKLVLCLSILIDICIIKLNRIIGLQYSTSLSILK